MKFYIDELSPILRQYKRDEITASKAVELINEKAESRTENKKEGQKEAELMDKIVPNFLIWVTNNRYVIDWGTGKYVAAWDNYGSYDEIQLWDMYKNENPELFIIQPLPSNERERKYSREEIFWFIDWLKQKKTTKQFLFNS